MLHLREKPQHGFFTEHSYCIGGGKYLNSYCVWRSWPAHMLALTRTSMNNLLNTEKESYSFPKLLFHFDFVYSPNFSPHMGKKCLMCTSLLGEKNPFSIKAGSYLGEIPSPWTQGSPEQRFSAPGGRGRLLIFQPVQASWRFRVCQAWHSCSLIALYPFK